tara:strand:- start:51 stop:560 length:510 start_codon:yes stop_codon:yes gene_type:complete
MIFSKSVNSLDRYDEIIAKEFTLIDDGGNVVMKLSQMDFEQINNLASWMQINSELYQKLNDAQNQLSNNYDIKIDSVNDNMAELKNTVVNSDKNLLNQINSLKEELNALQEQYTNYKRSINRRMNDTMNAKIPEIEAEIKKVNDRVNAILQSDIMQKEIKKNKKAYYLP